MDPIQLTIVGVSITLTLLIVILGIQVSFILKEMRRSLQKTNKMLDDAGKISGTVSQGVENMSGFVNGLRAGISMITSFTKKREE